MSAASVAASVAEKMRASNPSSSNAILSNRSGDTSAGTKLTQRDWGSAFTYLACEAPIDRGNSGELLQSVATSLATVDPHQLTGALVTTEGFADNAREGLVPEFSQKRREEVPRALGIHRFGGIGDGVCDCWFKDLVLCQNLIHLQCYKRTVDAAWAVRPATTIEQSYPLDGSSLCR